MRRSAFHPFDGTKLSIFPHNKCPNPQKWTKWTKIWTKWTKKWTKISRNGLAKGLAWTIPFQSFFLIFAKRLCFMHECGCLFGNDLLMGALFRNAIPQWTYEGSRFWRC